MPSTIKQIYDRFDRHPVIDNCADYSRIGRIGIASRGDTYRIVANPYGTTLGLNIDITAPGGIFGASMPVKVETSPNFGHLGMFVNDGSSNKPGTASGRMDRPAAAERLLLPGDEGFELFGNLHKQVGALKSVVADTIATSGVTLDPAQLQVSEKSGPQMLDVATGGTKHCRDVNYAVSDARGSIFHTQLDGSVITPTGIKPSEIPVFREGTYSFEDRPPQPLTLDSLVAFSGLQIAIQKLYA